MNGILIIYQRNIEKRYLINLDNVFLVTFDWPLLRIFTVGTSDSLCFYGKDASEVWDAIENHTNGQTTIVNLRKKHDTKDNPN